MNREGKKCVLYPRVSTEMQVDGYSLEGQKNSLKRFADREEMEIVGIYEDAGKSGKSIEGRPAFKKMLSDIKNGLEIEYILVYKLSRFGRNAADILNSLEFVQSYGINLICIEEGIDSSQTSGKLLISVLSAVAEIERENIIEQTMNGRREKARQGGWNGGFAPYGYYLKDNQLLIEETEAEAIRIIFDKFGNSDIGLGGVAKYLNLQGIKKIPRQNGKLETWSSHLIRQILDNPVYCGKIAYGRRTREKVKGIKNEYKQVHTDDYILEDGQHEGIVSEELWQKVHAKRKATGIKQPSKVGKDRSHLLTGVLKCPICGSSMYTNKHAWTNKDGTYDIGGMQYIYTDRQSDFEKYTRDEVFADMDLYLNKYGRDRLMQVKEVTTENAVNAGKFTVKNASATASTADPYATEVPDSTASADEATYDAYTVQASWTYDEDTDMDLSQAQKNAVFTVIDHDGRMEIAAIQ